TRVRDSISRARMPAPPQPLPSDPASGAAVDPSAALMSAAADLLLCDVPTLISQVKERCSQHLSALSERRYSAVEFDSRGGATLGCAGGKAEALALPAPDLDLYFLALRMTLAEKVGARAKVPLLVEDAFGQLDESRQQVLGRMLKQLGAVTQVIHVTGGAS